MFVFIPPLLRRFRASQAGVTLVEYGVAVALAIFVGTAAFSILTEDINESLGAAGDAMLDP